MKIARVVFVREVPSPRVVSQSRSHWVLSFEGPDFAITRDGDTLSVTSRETGRELLYPWCLVAGAEPEQLPAEPCAPPQPTQLPAHKKRP